MIPPTLLTKFYNASDCIEEVAELAEKAYYNGEISYTDLLDIYQQNIEIDNDLKRQLKVYRSYGELILQTNEFEWDYDLDGNYIGDQPGSTEIPF